MILYFGSSRAFLQQGVWAICIARETVTRISLWRGPISNQQDGLSVFMVYAVAQLYYTTIP
jgi:hypothetical protein